MLPWVPLHSHLAHLEMPRAMLFPKVVRNRQCLPMDRTRGYTAANRVAWNEIAPARPQPPADFFRGGNVTLDDVEVDLLGDVRAKTLLHLACANGNESLSWAVKGAAVTGVDISDVAIQMAANRAEAAGLDARFRAADVYALPSELGRFDIVYLSWGAICWMPDLYRWAQIVSRHLNAGGRLALFEHHPMLEVLSVSAGKIEVVADYFGGRGPAEERSDAAKRPTGWRPGVEFASFVWPTSEVLAAISRVGLHVTHFSEQPNPQLYDGLGGHAGWLPATYAVIATKP